MSEYSDDTSLRPPLFPKVADQDTQRALLEAQRTITELQRLLRASIKAIVKLGGSV